MGAFSGSALQLIWTWASGTLVMDTDYRSFNYQPGVEFYEETAGAASTKEYIVSMKTGQASFSGVMQAGSMAAYGSALKEGNLGTLVFRPEGSVAGKYTATIGAYSQGINFNQVYNQLVESTCNFMQTGVRSEGTL